MVAPLALAGGATCVLVRGFRPCCTACERCAAAPAQPAQPRPPTPSPAAPPLAAHPSPAQPLAARRTATRPPRSSETAPSPAPPGPVSEVWNVLDHTHPHGGGTLNARSRAPSNRAERLSEKPHRTSPQPVAPRIQSSRRFSASTTSSGVRLPRSRSSVYFASPSTSPSVRLPTSAKSTRYMEPEGAGTPTCSSTSYPSRRSCKRLRLSATDSDRLSAKASRLRAQATPRSPGIAASSSRSTACHCDSASAASRRGASATARRTPASSVTTLCSALARRATSRSVRERDVHSKPPISTTTDGTMAAWCLTMSRELWVCLAPISVTCTRSRCIP